MSNIMELIDAWAKGYAMHSKEGDEARAAVVEAVEKLERDAAMLSRVIVMHPDDPAIKHLDGVLVYVQRTLPKTEASK